MLTIKQLELLEFFQVEPRSVGSDPPWPYNQFTYEVELDELLLKCTINPADQDLDIVLTKNSKLLYQMNAENVHNLRLLKDNGRLTLEVELNARSRVLLKLKPRISILHTVSRGF